MVTADWQSWTYIRIGQYIASRGCILDFNFGARWVRYRKIINLPDDGVFDRGTFEGTFDEIWVDPSRSLSHPKDVIEAMDRGVVPESFVKLEDQDPKDYFTNERGGPCESNAARPPAGR